MRASWCNARVGKRYDRTMALQHSDKFNSSAAWTGLRLNQQSVDPRVQTVIRLSL